MPKDPDASTSAEQSKEQKTSYRTRCSKGYRAQTGPAHGYGHCFISRLARALWKLVNFREEELGADSHQSFLRSRIDEAWTGLWFTGRLGITADDNFDSHRLAWTVPTQET